LSQVTPGSCHPSQSLDGIGFAQVFSVGALLGVNVTKMGLFFGLSKVHADRISEDCDKSQSLQTLKTQDVAALASGLNPKCLPKSQALVKSDLNPDLTP
jgi:hypothetical protein